MAVQPLFATRSSWLTRAEQRLYDIDRLKLGEQPQELLDANGAGARAILISEIWFEHPIGADWVAAYRLNFEANETRVVVGEVRIFPSAGPREPNTGRWIADALGAAAPVPRGGVKARAVLRGLKLRAFHHDLKQIFEYFQVPLSVGRDESLAGAARPTRGRKPKPDQHYATAAVLYERFFLVEASARPTADVAKTMGLKPAAARAAIAKARKLGLLTPTARGESGGCATAHARTLDAGRAEKLLQRIATEVGTGRQKTAQVRLSPTKNARHSTRRNSGR